ncbi:hypothetical protein PHAVU_003G046000 [Phaseolus vulgaris]|uniref:Uncharacterized protein n=1 Tax=Phaseolus vulgaris TaxID=3885 RepID=V7C9G1_PHAVU|nr:hypothetical protein PHAVU_003G046000g [Phaseolus vulgaris]ESW25556.1 hypothetical protein PHAVU_003G046000g [Phaseolus vulgaris]
MGRKGCCEKLGLKKGRWTPEEDKKLLDYVGKHGHRNWRLVPAKAGLERCGKSCRLRWINYLKPDIKRGNFSTEEDHTIIQLHALLGNKLIRMSLDPITITHKTIKQNTFEGCGDGQDQSKDTINIRHVAQWERARFEAEARGSMLQVGSGSSNLSGLILSKIPTQPCLSSHSVSTENKRVHNMYALVLTTNHDFRSSVSTLSITKLPAVSNIPQNTNTKSLLAYKADNNVMGASTQIRKVMEGCVSNLQDDDIMVAVEAFRTARCESIEELLNEFTSM